MLVVQLANFHTPTSGGLRVALDHLAREYAHRGVDVIRVVPGERAERCVVDHPASPATVHEWSVPGWQVPNAGGYRVILRRAALVERLVQRRPDVVELSDKTSLVAVAAALRRRCGSKVVLVSHERLDAILEPRLPSWVDRIAFADRWNERLLRTADAVVAASSFAGEEFERIGAPVLRRVPLGVDLVTMNPAPDSTDDVRFDGEGRQTRPIRLVCVGRLSAEKRSHTAIDALGRLSDRGIDAELTMVGDGPELDRLRSMAAGLPVRFAGHLADPTRVAELLRAADVAIAPCPFETFGLAALEALACGTPVVVPDRGALRELVAHGVGRVAEQRPAAFADAIESLGRGDRRVQRAAARVHASAFTWRGAGTRMMSLFDDLTGPPRRGWSPASTTEVVGV